MDVTQEQQIRQWAIDMMEREKERLRELIMKNAYLASRGSYAFPTLQQNPQYDLKPQKPSSASSSLESKIGAHALKEKVDRFLETPVGKKLYSEDPSIGNNVQYDVAPLDDRIVAQVQSCYGGVNENGDSVIQSGFAKKGLATKQKLIFNEKYVHLLDGAYQMEKPTAKDIVLSDVLAHELRHTSENPDYNRSDKAETNTYAAQERLFKDLAREESDSSLRVLYQVQAAQNGRMANDLRANGEKEYRSIASSPAPSTSSYAVN